MSVGPDLLPPELQEQNKMRREIALPYPAVLKAIDLLEARGVLLLGWELLATYTDGGMGHHNVDGIRGIDGVTLPAADDDWGEAVRRSAALHRFTISEAWRFRETTPPEPGVQLIFNLAGTRRPGAA
jgi:hypothetical protein